MFNYYEEKLFKSKKKNTFTLHDALSLWVEAPSFAVADTLSKSLDYHRSSKGMHEIIADVRFPLDEKEKDIIKKLWKKYLSIGMKIRDNLLSKTNSSNEVPLTYIILISDKLLITREELKDLAKSIGDYPEFLFPDVKNEQQQAKESLNLDPRERNTLHLIIAALANKAKVDISDTNRDRVATVERALSNIGVNKVAEKTIRKHLDAAVTTANEKRE